MGELPDGWTERFEETTYHDHMDREYTKVAYESEDGTTVHVSDVQEPNSFGGWGYLIRTDEPGKGSLGLVESLDEAKEVAYSYMREHVPATA